MTLSISFSSDCYSFEMFYCGNLMLILRESCRKRRWPQFNGIICKCVVLVVREANSEYEIVANSWKYGTTYSNNLFFAIVDYDEGPEVFNSVSICCSSTEHILFIEFIVHWSQFWSLNLIFFIKPLTMKVNVFLVFLVDAHCYSLNNIFENLFCHIPQILSSPEMVSTTTQCSTHPPLSLLITSEAFHSKLGRGLE